MKRFYRITAGTLMVLGGFAAIGTGAIIVATALMMGALMALAAKLALKGMATNVTVSTDAGMDGNKVQA